MLLGGGGGDKSKLFSFKDAVMNTTTMSNEMNEDWGGGDLPLQEDVVRKEITDGVPSINFSERVYALIGESMSKTLIIKLLGRKINYNALWNKICAL